MILFSTTVLAMKEEASDFYYNSLKQAKYYLINGDTSRAKLTLERIQIYPSPLSSIFHRYQGILNFINGDYLESQKSLEKIISKSPSVESSWLPRICNIYLLDLFITDAAPSKMQYYWDRCEIVNAGKKHPLSPWVRTLVEIQNQKPLSANFNSIQGLNVDDLLQVLKLSLYLGKSRYFLNKLEYLKPEDFSNDLLREIVGEIFYRNKKLKSSLMVLKRLETVNALVIRSDIMSMQKKYEISYAYLKKAYEKNKTSKALLKRMIPLAIILGQTKDLEGILESYTRIHGLSPEIESIAAYNYYIRKAPKQTKTLLLSIEEKFKLSPEEMSLRVFGAYQDRDPSSFQKSYDLCLEHSAYCWIPLVDSYKLKRSRPKEVRSTLPFDDYYNLRDDGNLYEQEDIFIDHEQVKERSLFLDYMSAR